ncbi:MAG: glutathione S-transferase family protein [Pseudomonadota bacterium]
MTDPTFGAKNIPALVAALNMRLTEDARGQLIGASTVAPRFELYHAGFSICSNKVRCVLSEKRIPFTSHAMQIGPVEGRVQDNYLPEYLRLRMLGQPDASYVGGYSGASSMATEGFDPAVVPTLIDHAKERVVVDSRAICLYLDQEDGEGPRLNPPDIAGDISAQIDLIDRAPHVALLYGAHPDNDTRPQPLIDTITGIHARKIAGLAEVLKDVADEPALVRAYAHKIAKESAAASFVADGAKLRDVHAEFDSHVAALEAQLKASEGPWVFGERYTLADIMWTTSLFRLRLLGLQTLWAGGTERPMVSDYIKTGMARPSFGEAVLEWHPKARS